MITAVCVYAGIYCMQDIHIYHKCDHVRMHVYRPAVLMALILSMGERWKFKLKSAGV